MINFTQVNKGFGTQDVLVKTDFVIQSGWRVGIVGPNGAGKTTIFELIAGKLRPDKGAVDLPGSPRIGYVRQQLLSSQKPAETLLEFTERASPAVVDILHKIHDVENNLPLLQGPEREKQLSLLGHLQTEFEQLGGYELKIRAEATLSGLGFEESAFPRQFHTFSGGWQMRAELARNLIADPDILLLDEPTNYLDVPAIEWLRDFLSGFGGTLLLISHDRFLLNLLSDHILEVNKGQVTLYNGNYNSYVEEREQRRDQLIAAKRNQDRKKEQLDRFIERFRAKNTKASQVQSRVKMRERMEDIIVPEFQAATRLTLPPVQRSGDQVLKLRQAGFCYTPGEWIFRHLDLDIERGQKLAVVGLNGTGKTTLLRAIAGAYNLVEGERQLGASVTLGYMSQDFSDVMDPQLTVYETARGAAAAERSDGEIRNLLGGLGFGGDAIDKKVAVLSGGEKIRLSLARLLSKSCNFIILDEPTTHLDIGMREALQKALQDYRGTLCLVSHDIEFLRETANEILAMSKQDVKLFRGGYDYYCLKRQEVETEKEGAAEEAQIASNKGNRRLQKQQDARKRQKLYQLRKPLQNKIAETEDAVAALETEQHDLVAELQNNAATEDFETINRRLDFIQHEIAHLSIVWEQRSLELEELMEASE